MTVLVTGGAGFIGSHLVEALLARGDRVRVLDSLVTGDRRRLDGLDVDFVEGDVRDPDGIARALDGVTAVAHLAAVVSVPASVEAPSAAADVNVLGTVRLLEAAQREGVSHFVLASSCAVYGDAEGAVREDGPVRPASPYAASKLSAEHFVAAVAGGPTRALSLRFFNVFGPGQSATGGYAAAVPAFAAALARGERPVIFGDGHQTRDLVHVSDVVRALLLALEAPAFLAGRAFNVGTGRGTSVLDIVSAIARGLDRPADATHAPARAGDVRHSKADTESARSELGFEAQVDAADALERVALTYR